MNKIPLLIILLLLTKCNSNRYDYEVENRIMKCANQFHKENGIDLSDVFNKIENVLIQNKVMVDGSGGSYIKVIKHIRDFQTIPSNSATLKESIKNVGFVPSSLRLGANKECRLDSTDIMNSKLKYGAEIFQSIEVAGDINLATISEIALKHYTAEDFENDFYKSCCLMIIVNFAMMDPDPSTFPPGGTPPPPRIN